jgi:hypothetical protein
MKVDPAWRLETRQPTARARGGAGWRRPENHSGLQPPSAPAAASPADMGSRTAPRSVRKAVNHHEPGPRRRRRPARRTPCPGATATSDFKLAILGPFSPANPRRPLPSPHLRGRLEARRWRGTRAREAPAGGGGVSWCCRRSSVQSASATALGSSGGNGVTLHPGSGRGGARTTHGPSPRPPDRPTPPTWLLSAEGRGAPAARGITWSVALGLLFQ